MGGSGSVEGVPQAVVSAIGPDRAGIVARVTAVLLEHGCNIADSHMGLLSGRFTMMLVIAVPDDADRSRLTVELEHAAAELGLDALHVEPVTASVAAAPPTHVVTVYGADHTGIVAAVTAALAAGGASITDLQTRLGDDLYVMTLEVSGGDGAEAALRDVAAAQGLEVSVRAIDADVL